MDRLSTLLLLVGCGLCLVEGVWSDTEYQQLAAPEVTIKILEHPTIHHINKRKVVLFDTHSTKKWPNQIKYYIDSTFGDYEAQVIRNIIRDEFQAKTCITFTELRSLAVAREQFIRFAYNINPTECRTYIGMVNDTNFVLGQPISLGQHCFTFRGNMIYMLASTLGMFGEIKRPDRDTYIDIYRDNFLQGGRHSYAIESMDTATTHDVPYDYGSAMHLAAKDWLNESLPLYTSQFTVLPKDRRFARGIGQRSEFSIYDVMALNRAYCPHTCVSSNIICKNGGFLDPRDCTSCECLDGFGGFDCSLIAGSESCNPSSGELTVQPQINCVTSPHHQSAQNYDYDTTCSWVLKATPGKRIDAWFQTLGLPSPLPGFRPCLHWVELKVGGRHDVRGPRYCNGGIPPGLPANFSWADVNPDFAIPSRSIPIVSDQNEIMVIFKAPDFRVHERQQFVDSNGDPINYTGFQLCYKISSRTHTSTTSHPDEPKIGAQTGDESDDHRSNLTVIGVVVAVLLVVIIILLALLICCVYRRRRKLAQTTASTEYPQQQVAFENQGYATSNVRISTVLENIDIDSVKKDPAELDFSHVGQHDVSGVMAGYEPPPSYVATPPSDGKDMYLYSDASTVPYSTSPDSTFENESNAIRDVNHK